MKFRHHRGPNERGATGVEHALVISFVSLLVVAATVTLGGGFVTWAATIADTIGMLLS
jgi:Flp pilus assembly pilin Flp